MVCMKTDSECLRHSENIVWDENIGPEEMVRGIQNLLYQRGALLDNVTDEMFGDDDAHIHSPNMRRI